MGNLGLESAGGLSALQAQLRQQIMDQIAAEERQRKALTEDRQFGLQSRQLDQADAYRRDQLAETTRQHSMADADRNIGLSNTLADQIPPGAEMAPSDPAVKLLQEGGRGSLLTHADPNLASTSTMGGMTLPGGPQPIRGTLRSIAQPAKPERYIKGASQKQADAEAERSRKTTADEGLQQYREGQLQNQGQLADIRGRMADIAGQNADLKGRIADQKAAQGPKLPQREDDTVVSIHQMSPLIDELLAKTQARIASKPKQGMLGAVGEKVGRVATKAAYSAGLPVAPADSERIQLASLLEILGTVPYLRGIRNMEFVKQIQQHLSDPTATDESLAERLTTLKRILPGMEQAIYDVHNGGKIPHSHDTLGAAPALAPSHAPSGAQEYDYVPGKGLIPRGPK